MPHRWRTLAGRKHRQSQPREGYLVGISRGGRGIAGVEEGATIGVRQKPGPGSRLLWRRVVGTDAHVFNCSVEERGAWRGQGLDEAPVTEPQGSIDVQLIRFDGEHTRNERIAEIA